jgi:hypothetical protein
VKSWHVVGRSREDLAVSTILGYPIFMAKSIRDIPKKRGRPRTTGRGEGILLRLHQPQLDALDAWIEHQDDSPSRPEAIRRLIEQALAPATSLRPRNSESRRKAAELAAREIDRLGQAPASPEEAARRNRRLIKGPREFRDVRGDRPKTK